MIRRAFHRFRFGHWPVAVYLWLSGEARQPARACRLCWLDAYRADERRRIGAGPF